MKERPWSPKDLADVVQLTAHSVPPRTVARILNRTPTAVRWRLWRLRHTKPATGPAASPPPDLQPVQLGDIAVASFRERVLERSVSTQSGSALESEAPLPKPTAPGAPVYARMAINPVDGSLVLVREDPGTDKIPTPRDAMHGTLGLLA